MSRPFLVQNLLKSITDFQLYDNAEHSILSTTSPLSSNYLILVYYRVIGLANLKLSIVWTDNSGPQTVIPVNGQQSLGSCNLEPIYITSIQGTEISVKAQADTKNTIFVSATIVELR